MEHLSLLAFVLAALVVLLIPGPGVIYVVTRSLTQGRKAGLVSVLGLSVGALVHVLAATAGLSALLLTSATAFGLVKILGACYLIYLGIRALPTRTSVATTSTLQQDSLHRIFADGVLVSVFNPKIAVFFLAFLPQFVNPELGAVTLQFFLLGLLYVILAFCTDGAYALFASYFRSLLGRSRMPESLPRYASGIVYLGLGIGLALSDRKSPL